MSVIVALVAFLLVNVPYLIINYIEIATVVFRFEVV